MAIQKVKIRARIQVGNFNVETPYILSFNVNRSRGQISTFDARIKIATDSIADMTGGPIRIYAGTGQANTLIYTGIVRKATMSPCFDDPYYVIINLSGADVLSLLQSKKYTRRCRATETSWATIDGVARKGLKSGKFKYRKEPVLLIAESELKENQQLVTGSSASKKISIGRPVPKGQAAGAKLIAEIIAE
jgi:hypothetical protein